MSLSVFEVKENLSFLLYKKSPSYIRLHAEKSNTINPVTFDSLFNGCYTIAYDDLDLGYIKIMINSACNNIAANTRRGPGNIIFVQSKDIFEDVQSHFAKMGIVTYLHEDMMPGEIRVAYWKLYGSEVETAVDGALQIVNGTTFINDNGVFPPTSYFAKLIYKPVRFTGG